MDYKVAYYMNIGRRDNQEDCIFINGRIFQKNKFRNAHVMMIRGSRALCAVCDGMGGHAKGEWASRFVCEKLKDYLKHFTFSRDTIQHLFNEIQERIEKEGIKDNGTTVACAILEDGKNIIFNAGDSRIYKITNEAILCISHDHSLVQSIVDKGYLSQDEAFIHPHKNVIEFGIGDVFRRAWSKGDKEVFIKDDVLNKDEYYLICTDGVNDVLRDEEIYDMLYPDPFVRYPEFIECLKERMKDNLSFIVIGNG